MNNSRLQNNWTGGQFSFIRMFIGAMGIIYALLNWTALSSSGFGLFAAILFTVSSAALAIGLQTQKSSISTCLSWLLIWFCSSQINFLSLSLGICTYLYISSLDKNPILSADAAKEEFPNFSWSIDHNMYVDLWRAWASVWLIVSFGFLLRELIVGPGAENSILSFTGFLTNCTSSCSTSILTMGVIEFALALLMFAKGPSKTLWTLVFVLIAASAFLNQSGLFFLDLSCFLLLFSPAWLASSAKTSPELIFYDGECGLCHRWVKLVLSEDPQGNLFQFAPIQSSLFKKISKDLEDGLDSIIVSPENGDPLIKSSAIAYILKRLGGLWIIDGWTLYFVPRPLRDLGYDFVAAIRHRIFKKPSEACPLMPADLRRRFKF